ncbi:MAG: hypothetical protein HFJ45_05200 [Clostridia bacterium]|nr:hypothetical protein [Clostridia bacterium]
MKQNLKNQTGAAFIVVILVIIVAVLAGGAAFLGVRMLVQGGSFLQPFEELGWISSSEDEDDKEDKDEKKDNKKDKNNVDNENVENKTNKKDDNKNTTSGSKTSNTTSSKGSVLESRLSSEAKKSDTEHYYGSMTMADYPEYSNSNDEFADLYSLLKLEVNLYARDSKVVEIVFTVNMKDFLESAYDLYEDDFKASGYTTYKDFEDEMVPIFESAFDFGFDSALEDNEMKNYVSKYVEDGNIQVYITEEGFESLYDNYGIKDGEENVDTIIDALEESMGITIKKSK